ncbi:hypothetical protein Pint_25912 [Pistacia integerrima]|uniref:Uncharacterized protein n=1 Tax=Pistacia integerrima TaxID=434235 RepID=A0ACC0YGJ1_9ROSI|nr:hypothetical protein Pint_25912 [Pistacia integerrima]
MQAPLLELRERIEGFRVTIEGSILALQSGLKKDWRLLRLGRLLNCCLTHFMLFLSPVLWASFVLFLLVNVNGWQALLWASLIPVIIILAIGMELQSILTQMALEITRKTCGGARDATCTGLRQILLVWSTSFSASSHSLRFVLGTE